MTTVLITGANRGLGFEFARQYAADGDHVIACCRDPDKADNLKKITDIRIERLDVADETSIAALAAKLKDTPIDMLINNAGIFSGTGRMGHDFPNDSDDKSQEFGTLDTEAWVNALRVNTIAPIMMIQAFAPVLQKGNDKKIINITSKMGSIGDMAIRDKNGAIAYRSSKAALNAAMRAITPDLRSFGLSIFNLHPGWVQTDMGGAYADMTPEQSVAALRQTITKLTAKDSGQFFNYDGQILPW